MEDGNASLGRLLRHVSTFDVNHSVAKSPVTPSQTGS